MTSCILTLTLAAVLVEGSVQIDKQVEIINTGEYVYYFTDYTDLGVNIGNILNAHFFPGMKYYEAGRYKEAAGELYYFVERPTYINGNPNQAQWLSEAHYVRGMIFLYHATGLGRLSLAMNSFESAIKWNAKNYLAYLELSRVFSSAGLKDQAASILQVLLDLPPEDEQIVEEARRELKTITTKPPQPVHTPDSPSEQGFRDH